MMYALWKSEITRSCYRASFRTFSTPKRLCQKTAHVQPKSKPKVEDVQVEKIRNIGIMAHIDAGKTTTTERMLYFAGLTRHIGNVDKGDTVMDYMEQERKRGITISSAAISFTWNNHKINLIDTPGHVDFTLEVERSLRVLDGAITVLDATAGVEAQTLTVWKQADKYGVPRIIYLNKMDRTGASLERCIESIIEKLHIVPLITQVPIGCDKKFKGFVDLVTFRKFIWDIVNPDNDNYTVTEIDQHTDEGLYEEVCLHRNKLIEQLADMDDCIANHVLNDMDYNKIPAVDLMNALRKATLTQKGIPVLCGSSFKNRGVEPLMNAIVSLLPNPTERKYPFVEYYEDNLCALAFKIIHDKQRGPLTFLRLYNGYLKSGSPVYNVNSDTTEKTGRLLQIYADEHKELSVASTGSIVAVTGLKEAVTGDTVVSNSQAAKAAKKNYSNAHKLSDEESVAPVLAGLEVPEPVFMCSVEPPSLSAQKTLDQALTCLTREDPSLRVSVDKDTGQTILSGMGELHLEIIKDRILKEYGVDVYMGPLQISYREAITTRVEETYSLDKTIGSTRHRATMCLSIQPAEGRKHDRIDIVPHKESELNPNRIWRPVLEAINSGVKSALSRGPILGSPVIDVKVELHNFTKTYSTSLPMVSACAALCVTQALKTSGAMVLQPMMGLEIHTDETYLNRVLGDLSKRNSNIIDVEIKNNARTVQAETPLSQMVGYSTALRTLSSGTATFTMELSHYDRMGPYEQSKAIEKSTGFMAGT